MLALVERLFETGRTPDWPMDLPDRMEFRALNPGLAKFPGIGR